VKIRLDFVTNSSSSSFVCAICNHTEEVYEDAQSLWHYCKICNCQFEQKCSGIEWLADLLDPIVRPIVLRAIATFEGILKDLDGNDEWYEATSTRFNNSISKCKDMLTWLDKPDYTNEKIVKSIIDAVLKSRDNLPVEAHCPICDLDRVPKDSIFDYLVKKSGKTVAQIAKEIQEEFETFEKLTNALSTKG